MFGNSAVSQIFMNDALNHVDTHLALRQQSAQTFQKMFRAGRLRRLWAWLHGRCSDLRKLAQAQGEQEVVARHYEGVRPVAIEQIVGSEGREADFDAEFYPRRNHNRDRWISVAVARMTGKALPPVDLVQINDAYFVRDGHHRISVARMMGEMMIDAQVTRWQIR
jgi:hypothetical protein